MTRPRLIQTFLTDGTLEGIRVVDQEGDIEAYIIPHSAGQTMDEVMRRGE